MYSTLAAIGLVVVVAVARNYYLNRQADREFERFRQQKSCKQPKIYKGPFPLGIPMIVKLFQNDNAGTIMHFFKAMGQSIGSTFEQILLANSSIATMDPKNIEAMLGTQFSDFGLGARAPNLAALLGHGIFTQDGAAWKASRDLLRPQFNHARSDNFDDVQEEVVSMLKTLPVNPQGEVIDLQPHFFKFTLNTTMAVLFGREYMSTINESQEDEFASAFNTAQHWLARRGRFGDFYWLVGGKSLRDACKVCHDHVDKIVQAALADDKAGQGSKIEDDEGRYVFLQALIKRTKDPKELRDQMLNVLLAGRDTTACLLSWIFRLLAQYPEVQHRLRQECVQLPSYANGDLPTRAELKKMQYLEMVVREVLRLYPSVPVNVRTALKMTTLPRGGGLDGNSPIVVRKGWEINYSVYVMHRSKDLYGPDADDFRPERWVPGSNTMTDHGDVGWGYLPFNGGARICLGREFALTEASYATVCLLQKYAKIEMPPGKPYEPLGQEKHLLTLVVQSADGCCVKLTPA